MPDFAQPYSPNLVALKHEVKLVSRACDMAGDMEVSDENPMVTPFSTVDMSAMRDFSILH